MPALRGVTVSVISEHDGVPLQEWGTRRLRGAQTCSCYIESRTDVQFRIKLTPTIPYVADDRPTAHSYNTRQRSKLKSGCEDTQMSDDKPQPPKHRTSGSEDHIKAEEEEQNTDLLHSPPDWSSSRTLPPPFHFVASLYLDGRTKPERQLVVYLDPANPDFNLPDGTVHFRSRWVRGADGVIRSHGWVFKDVGIETLFDKLQLSGAMASEGQILKKDEDEIIAAMHSTGLEDKEEKAAPGLIMVTLERVTLGEVWADRNFQPEHAEGEGDGGEEGEGAMENTEDIQVSHTAGLVEGQPLPSTPIRVVTYQRFKKNGKKGGANEGLYATFKFFYRSADILRKFNFTGFPLPPEQPAPPKQSRTHRALNRKLAFLTPLSISNAPSQPTRTPLDEEGWREDSALRSSSSDGPAKANGAAAATRNRASTPEYKPYSSYRTHPEHSDEEEDTEVEGMDGRVAKRSRVDSEQETAAIQDVSDL